MGVGTTVSGTIVHGGWTCWGRMEECWILWGCACYIFPCVLGIGSLYTSGGVKTALCGDVGSVISFRLWGGNLIEDLIYINNPIHVRLWGW